MGRIFYSILIFLGLTFLYACNKPQPEAPKLLAEAERLIEVMGDLIASQGLYSEAIGHYKNAEHLI